MPGENEFTIRFNASNVDQTVSGVEKVSASTRGFGGQSEGTTRSVQGLRESLEETERSVQEAAEAIEELTAVTDSLNEATEENAEASEEASRRRRRQAERDVEDVRTRQEEQRAALERRQRVAAAGAAAAVFAVNQYASAFRQYSADLRTINGDTDEAANAVSNLGVHVEDFGDTATNVLAGFAAGGPVGAIAGAFKSAVDIVTDGTRRAAEAIERSRDVLAGQVADLQRVVNLERERAFDNSRDEVLQDYQTEITLIENLLRQKQRQVEVERLLTGRDLTITRQNEGQVRNQIQRSDLGPIEQTEEVNASFRRQAQAESGARQATLASDIREVENQREAALARADELRDFTNNLSALTLGLGQADQEVIALLDQAVDSAENRSSIRQSGEDSIQRIKDALSEEQQGLFDQLLEAVNQASAADIEIEQIRENFAIREEAFANEFRIAEEERTASLLTTIEQEGARSAQRLTEQLQPILDQPFDELSLNLQQARTTVERVLEDGRVQASEIEILTSALTQFTNAQSDALTATTNNLGSLTNQIQRLRADLNSQARKIQGLGAQQRRFGN